MAKRCENELFSLGVGEERLRLDSKLQHIDTSSAFSKKPNKGFISKQVAVYKSGIIRFFGALQNKIALLFDISGYLYF